MRLISNFRDFYDGAQGTDREPEPVFVRNTEETLIPWEDKKRLAELEPFTGFADRKHMPWSHEFDNAGVDRVRIAFCGKGYAFYRWQERLFATPMSNPIRATLWGRRSDAERRVSAVLRDGIFLRGPNIPFFKGPVELHRLLVSAQVASRETFDMQSIPEEYLDVPITRLSR